MSAPCLLIAAPASGSGKTVLTLGLLRALRDQGMEVRSFKVGPDYIDPAFHHAASGRPCLNLDSWAMRTETLAGLMGELGEQADLVVGEGVMGLFDGAPGGKGSTADLAALFMLPVILVVDAAGMGASVAALVEGFCRHRPEVEITGLIFNRVGGERHARLLRDACEASLSLPILGWLGREEGLALPSRHLGLVQAGEHPALEGFIARAAARVAAGIDLGRLARLARHPGLVLHGAPAAPLPPLGQRIAVAADPAFGFSYAATLAGWRRQGAEVVPFRPLADEAPDPAADAVFLPGGYPELHAPRLAAAGRFLAGLRDAASRGAAIHGECGGYMVLGRSLIDADGTPHAMAGLLPLVTSFAERRRELGYRRVVLEAETALGRRGDRFRGHEYHWATEIERAGPPLFASRTAAGREALPEGIALGRITGSFVHLIDRADGAG